MGRIRDGYYAAANEVKLLWGSSQAELQTLLGALRDVRSGRLDVETASERLEEAGEAGSTIAKLLRSRSSRMELWTFIAMLIAVATLVVALKGSTNTPAEGETVNVTNVISVDDSPSLNDEQIERIISEAIDSCLGESVLPPEDEVTLGSA